MKTEYISVKDFADRAGVTHQNIYKRLNRDMKPYKKVTNGVTTVSVEALKLFSATEKGASVEAPQSEPATENIDASAEVHKIEIKSLQREVELLRAENTILRNQLEIKDKQIETMCELTRNNQVITVQATKLLEQPDMKSEKRSWFRRKK